MLYVFCVECRDKMMRNKRYNAYSVVATHGKCPRVDFAFACQPWAIRSTTLTALIHTLHDTINFIQQLDLMVHDMEIHNPYGVDSYIPQYNLLVF